MQLRFLWRGFKTWLYEHRCEISALRSALAPDEIAIDVGSHKGSFLWGLSRAVPRGKVVAFEPQPSLAEYLRTACDRWRLRNVVVENAGVSEFSGRLTLAIPGTAGISHGASFEPVIRETKKCQTIEVPTYSLDDYFAHETRRIGAIKIDVEGHELSVLRGAARLIERHGPLIVCECESRNMTSGDVSTTLQWFADHDYAGHFVHRQRLLPLGQFDPDVHQRREGKRYWDHPDYCNNFVLRPVTRSFSDRALVKWIATSKQRQLVESQE
jgi:FkbM family methyltransferase